MSTEYPLYPQLSETGKVEAQKVIDKFKADLIESQNNAIEKAMSDFYCDVLPFIESDSWSNFRNQVMAGYKNYNNRTIQAEHDFKTIRQEILKEHREDIIKDLNQDLVEEVESLKRTIEIIQSHNSY